MKIFFLSIWDLLVIGLYFPDLVTYKYSFIINTWVLGEFEYLLRETVKSYPNSVGLSFKDFLHQGGILSECAKNVS